MSGADAIVSKSSYGGYGTSPPGSGGAAKH
jgi:hypothetical protein